MAQSVKTNTHDYLCKYIYDSYNFKQIYVDFERIPMKSKVLLPPPPATSQHLLSRTSVALDFYSLLIPLTVIELSLQALHTMMLF